MVFFIRQSLFIPFYFFIPVITAGIIDPNFNWVSQHGSEITLMNNDTAIFFLNTGAILAGISCILMSVGIFIKNGKSTLFTSSILSVFGVSMITNGLFPMGNPMHGFYGIGLSIMLLPFISCYELKGSSVNKKYFSISVVAGFLIFIYFWAMLVGIEPADYTGLTQRLASLVIFGWVAYSAYEFEKATLPKEIL